MDRLSKREVDIDELAKTLEFKPVKKKQIRYLKVSTDNLQPFTYGIAKEKQLVETFTTDGKETQNTAEAGDLIFCGPSGEKYVLKPAKVKTKYVGEIGGTLIPEQTPRQIALYDGDEVSFKAPWGESMVLKPGDYLCKESDGSGYYRIAKKEFEETYNSF